MDRIITLLCALVLAAAGMAAWDRHPPISFPFLFWHVHLPNSLATERDIAMSESADAKIAQATCRTTLTLQSAEINRLSAEGAAALAQAQKALAATQTENDKLRAGATKVRGLGIGAMAIGDPGRCVAYETVDSTITEAVK